MMSWVLAARPVQFSTRFGACFRVPAPIIFLCKSTGSKIATWHGNQSSGKGVRMTMKGIFSAFFIFLFLSVCPSCAQGWLVDLINKFGTLGGFQILHDRLMSGQALNVQIIAAFIK